MQRLIHTIKQSLQVKISIALICMLLPLSILAGIFSYYDTYHETQEVQDDLLRQVANYLDPSDADDEKHSLDNDNKISVQFPNTPNPIVSLPEQISDGLHTIQADDDDDYYRVYTRNTKQGRIAVMQESDYREELAEMAAVQSILPMLLALPLIILLTVWITHRAMRSVKTLSNDLEQRQINDLSPMDTKDIPSEIQGFVVAINNLLQRTDEKRPPTATLYRRCRTRIAQPHDRPFPSGRAAQQYAAVRRSTRTVRPVATKHTAQPPPARATPFPRTRPSTRNPTPQNPDQPAKSVPPRLAGTHATGVGQKVKTSASPLKTTAKSTPTTLKSTPSSKPLPTTPSAIPQKAAA